MTSKKELSATGRLDLGGVLKDLHQFRKTTIRQVVRGATLVELFVEEVKSLRLEGARPSEVLPFLLQKMGALPDSIWLTAAASVSAMAENNQSGVSYHDSNHVVEVIIASYVLGRRERLPAERLYELLLAATAHDVGHTGGNNQVAFELESRSFDLSCPYFQNAGLSAESIERIRRMILATDYVAGAPEARKDYAQTRCLPPGDEKRLLAAQALLLTEADVLFSCFNVSYNELLSRLLSQEWKRPDQNLSLEERLRFLTSVQFISDASRQLGLEDRRLGLIQEISRDLNRK